MPLPPVLGWGVGLRGVCAVRRRVCVLVDDDGGRGGYSSARCLPSFERPPERPDRSNQHFQTQRQGVVGVASVPPAQQQQGPRSIEAAPVMHF